MARKDREQTKRPAAVDEPSKLLPVDPVLEELRAIRELLALIAAATVRTALTGDVGAPDNYRLLDKLREGAPWLTADLPRVDDEKVRDDDDRR